MPFRALIALRSTSERTPAQAAARLESSAIETRAVIADPSRPRTLPRPMHDPRSDQVGRPSGHPPFLEPLYVTAVLSTREGRVRPD